ncbi:MAG: hypothetical protein EZS28_040608 [Streblomastix strix]|uniref:Uncharacterized protein n=1 Tax=Streblomastix strix TaxID=222440 RepID=A0A5J4TZK1_9EUKA|nr:MAG: hypothetical protein EZS28_040608 [Streblomastix strix]
MIKLLKADFQSIVDLNTCLLSNNKRIRADSIKAPTIRQKAALTIPVQSSFSLTQNGSFGLIKQSINSSVSATMTLPSNFVVVQSIANVQNEYLSVPLSAYIHLLPSHPIISPSQICTTPNLNNNCFTVAEPDLLKRPIADYLRYTKGALLSSH